MSTDPDHHDDDLHWAREHAWRWFEYHAGQRMAAFRFYLIIIAFLFAGYSTLITNSFYAPSVVIAIMILAITYLFWRLDLRNRQLVKISELFLKNEEQVIGSQLNRPELKILLAADDKWYKWPCSYSAIYSLLFCMVAVVSLGIGAWSVWSIQHVSPPSSDHPTRGSVVCAPAPVRQHHDQKSPPQKFIKQPS